MERMFRLRRRQLMGPVVHGNIGRLDGYDQIVIPHILDQLHIAKRAFRQSLSRDATVFLNDILLQGAGIDTDPDWDAVLSGRVHHGSDPVSRAYVSRIYPYFVCAGFYGTDGQPVIKMYIRHQRHAGLFSYASEDIQ